MTILRKEHQHGLGNSFRARPTQTFGVQQAMAHSAARPVSSQVETTFGELPGTSFEENRRNQRHAPPTFRFFLPWPWAAQDSIDGDCTKQILHTSTR